VPDTNTLGPAEVEDPQPPRVLGPALGGVPGNGLVGDELLEVDRLAMLLGFDVEADRPAAASEPQWGRKQ
jgi:hypothetical protein